MKLTFRLSAALIFAAALPVTAQGAAAGTVKFQMTVKMPDSLKALGPVGDSINMQMTLMTDGQRLAMEMLTSGGPSPMGAGHIRMIFSPAGDTIHMGIFLPPEAAAAMGGGSGMRMDMPVSMMGAGNPLVGGMMDSIGKSMAKDGSKPTYRSLGRTSMVAGIRCEEWEMIAMGDTVQTCVIPTPPALLQLQERFKAMSGVTSMMAQMPGLANMEKEAYGGKQMVAIRTVMAKTGMRMELINFTAGAPDPAAFELPADMMVMPMPGKPGGGTR